MNVDLKELWAKLQNYVDPILAGIITLSILNLVGLGLVYYVVNIPPVEHPIEVVRVTEREPYEPVFTDEEKSTELPDTYARLLSYNFFKPGAGGMPTPTPTPPVGTPETGSVTPSPDQAQLITKVDYLGGVFASGRGGVAQLRSAEASDPATVFMVREGNTIPGTDISLQRIDRYYVVLSRPGFKDTQVPVRGAVQITAPFPAAVSPASTGRRRRTP